MFGIFRSPPARLNKTTGNVDNRSAGTWARLLHKESQRSVSLSVLPKDKTGLPRCRLDLPLITSRFPISILPRGRTHLTRFLPLQNGTRLLLISSSTSTFPAFSASMRFHPRHHHYQHSFHISELLEAKGACRPPLTTTQIPSHSFRYNHDTAEARSRTMKASRLNTRRAMGRALQTGALPVPARVSPHCATQTTSHYCPRTQIKRPFM